MPVPDALYLNLPLFLLGFIIIIRGSDLFLDNAVWMARASGISQVVIGATIVSFCTTLPELVSSSTAALKGTADIAIGNAVGSIICNTGLILGVVLFFTVARIKREIFLIKGTFMLGAILICLLIMWPAEGETAFALTRQEGLALLVFVGVFIVVNYYESLHTVDEPHPTVQEPHSPERVHVTTHEITKRLFLFAGGAAAVACGAYLLVEFGQRLARNMGISEAVISLLFIALGTSLPELFTGISAIRKNAEAVSVGNIFGANVLNIVLVVGASSAITPLYPTDRWLVPFDIPVALLICTVAFGLGLVRGRIGRKTGITLISIYVAYLISMLAMGRIA
ncbi:MAG: calcium/sodium antiporter [Candidatus Pacebacteria bacterium]|nr:calcium/sodium antiporter [Candidatus Paceibacterota bacterium]